MKTSKGFDALRIAVVAAGTLAGSLFGGFSRSARAANQNMPINVLAGGANWTSINNDVDFFAPCGGKGAGKSQPRPAGQGPGTCTLGISEGSLVGPPIRSDGLDGALAIAVNGAGFINPDGNLDLTGTTVTSDTRVLSGLTTQVQYYFSPSAPITRAVYSFTNGTAAAISATITVASNLGSDGSTLVQATTDGDTIVETTDRWILTSDATPTTGDPTLLWIRYGVGAGTIVGTQPQVPGTGNDNFFDTYAISVAPGQTRRLMVFLRLGTDVPTNQAAAATFNDLNALNGAGLLTGLSAAQQAELVNWGVTGAPPSASFAQSVPTIGTWGKLALVLSVGGLGAMIAGRRFRPRRQKA